MKRAGDIGAGAAHPPPEDHHRSLGIGLLHGLTGRVFLMSEVPLYAPWK